MTDERRKLTPEARVALWLAAGTIIVSAVSFWARGSDLPGRMSCAEISIAELKISQGYIKESLNRLLDANDIERPKEK